MSVNIEVDLKEILAQINQKLGKIDARLNRLEIGQARLAEKVDGLGKRIASQEFINRGVLISLIVALLGGLAKMFGLVGNP